MAITLRLGKKPVEPFKSKQKAIALVKKIGKSRSFKPFIRSSRGIYFVGKQKK